MSERTLRLLEAVSSLDLTSLRGDETHEEILALCVRAVAPLGKSGPAGVRVAAVCVLPPAVAAAVEALRGSGVRVACACGDFPSGRAPLRDRVQEIERAVASGADEIDAVVQREAIRAGAWGEVDEEIRALVAASGPARFKVILGTGALEPDRIARASRIALDAGVSFLKTSTGKDRVNATLEAGRVMARELRGHAERTGVKIGLKPAGGVRSADDALAWLDLVDAELGAAWRTPERFRIGASALLDDLARALGAEPD